MQSVITGATIYRGTWDPDVSLNSGYGSPDLSGVTQTSGYYYICSADGAATPNGATTEPNTWNTGDWVIWNDDIGTSGEWQKIDNSSVLSGVGTGQTVALWQGASSVTDSETLGNAPITVSGNNSTFAGDVVIDDGVGRLTLDSTSGTNRILSTTTGFGTYELLELRAEAYEFKIGTTEKLTIDGSGNATFAGTVLIDGVSNYTGLEVKGVGGSRPEIKWSNANNGNLGNIYGTETNSLVIATGSSGTTALTLEASQNATFAGNVSIVDNKYFAAGTGGDLIIRHLSSDNSSYIQSYTGDFYFENRATTKSMFFRVSNSSAGDTTAVTIKSNGNVGIGTTNPSEKLVVDGKVIINNAAPPNNLAQLNIGYTSSGETRAIDIDGGWGSGENKSITFTHGSAAANIVGQINCVLVNGTDTRLRWGKLYHNADSSTYTMELKSTSTTTANLTVAGSIQMANDTATASAAKVGTMRYRTGTEYVEDTGIQLLLNNNFDTDTVWSKGTGWAISGGKANATASTDYLSQNPYNPVASAYYQITWTISNYSAGTYRFYMRGNVSADFGTSTYIGNGTFTHVMQAGGGGANGFLFDARSALTASIDDIILTAVSVEAASYADMCMQTGSSTYEWVNIVRNTY